MDASLVTRLKTAGILAVPLLALMLLGMVTSIGQSLLIIIAGAVVVACAYEFARICRSETGRPHLTTYLPICLFGPVLAGVVGLVGCVATGLNGQTTLLITFYISCLAAGIYAFLGGRNNPDHSQACVRELSIGLLLISFCGSALILTLAARGGVALIFWLLLVVIANDVGAYFGGRKFGGEKLSPFVSPNKTISGACAGLLAGLIVGILFLFFLPVRDLLSVAVLALAVGGSAQLGDLAKSYIKRLYSAKDMGAILPGHGGVLDRVDGILAAAPWALLMVSSFN